MILHTVPIKATETQVLNLMIDLQQRFATMQTPIQYLDAPEFRAFWLRESEVLGQVVRAIGKVE